MQVPETPHSIEQLDLMKRLDAYANGEASWLPGGGEVGESAKQACRVLHTNLVQLVNGIFAYVLDRVTAREMETFTMHDRVHGRKVAHLMWHILTAQRRETLTPPEIGILVVAAHLHDLGMGLSRAEREARLAPDSDLWDRLEIQDSVRVAIEKLREQIGNPRTSETVKKRAGRELFQAEEALLTQDTRERHATRERYEEILSLLDKFHARDRARVPDIEACLSFDGDSFREKLIDVCVSHNEDADALVGNDEKNFGRPRFPADFPVGCCVADLHTVAAALRLADILDFDRERTPAVLFHYLLPGTVSGLENRSVLEWSKHLAVSNWHIEKDAVIFRGRSTSHVIHHAVVQFSSVITDEIRATHATFSPLGEASWPFILPLSVKADIHEEGYRYVPYKFELDDERVYSLLMGGAIYDNPLVAVRELVQNAVDACKLRDSLLCLYGPHERPGTEKRIFIRYEEPTDQHPQPRLSVRDTGTGMDAYILERYFLQVGRSYYNSSDFNQVRVQLRKSSLDFAPVSEFGIGFLSAFLLANHVEVETSIWESPRGDTAKRTLQINGPTRLIRLDEQRNDGPGRFKGTRITLHLSPITYLSKEAVPAAWQDIKNYLEDVCQDLPYSLHLEYVSGGQVVEDRIDPLPLSVKVPPHWEPAALRIPVNDREFGLEGQIALFNPYALMQEERSLLEDRAATDAPLSETEKTVFRVATRQEVRLDSVLLRGGFKIADVPGLPDNYDLLYLGMTPAAARLRLTWASRTNRRLLLPNLARNAVTDKSQVTQRVIRAWLDYLIRHVDELPEGQIWGSYASDLRKSFWLEEHDALALYRLARQDWLFDLRQQGVDKNDFEAWENGDGVPLLFEPGKFNLRTALLNLIMPRVTRIQLGASGVRYIMPPQSGWLDVLAGWRDYITSPVKWDGQFIEYVGGVKDLLLYSDDKATGLINSHHQDRFALWERAEVEVLFGILAQLADSRREEYSLTLTPKEAELFRRAVEVAGDLKVGTPDNSWALNSFTIADN